MQEQASSFSALSRHIIGEGCFVADDEKNLISHIDLLC